MYTFFCDEYDCCYNNNFFESHKFTFSCKNVNSGLLLIWIVLYNPNFPLSFHRALFFGAKSFRTLSSFVRAACGPIKTLASLIRHLEVAVINQNLWYHSLYSPIIWTLHIYINFKLHLMLNLYSYNLLPLTNFYMLFSNRIFEYIYFSSMLTMYYVYIYVTWTSETASFVSWSQTYFYWFLRKTKGKF